jgi:hypothetical protein
VECKHPEEAGFDGFYCDTLTAEVERLRKIEATAKNLIESDDNLRVLNEWGDPAGYYEVDEEVFERLKQALEEA